VVVRRERNRKRSLKELRVPGREGRRGFGIASEIDPAGLGLNRIKSKPSFREVAGADVAAK